MSNYTPGPWEVSSDWRGTEILHDERTGVSVCIARIARCYEDKSNACLIAAAPDLLEACTELFMQMRREGSGTQAMLKRALAAINKANGD